jgi:flagellar hook-associated protein 2
MSSLVTGVGTVSTNGASTGINTSALLDELVNAASGPRNQIQNKINSYEQLSGLYSSLNTQLSTLDTSLSAIQTESTFREFSGTSTDSDVFTVDTDGDAVAGSYAITVTQLAQAQINNVAIGGSVRYETATQTIFGSGESGTIAITINGSEETVSVTDATTVADLASSLDDIDGITAYIVQIQDDSATGTDEFQLFVQADTAGQYEGGDRLDFDFSNLTATAGSDNELQAGTNATATIAGQTITSATNTFTAIDGIEITAVSTGSATATVALDTDAMATKVETFVDAYNSILSFIELHSSFSSSGTNQSSVSIGAFVGESAPRYVRQRMSTILTADYGSALSLSSSTQRTALSQIGISTDEDTGQLVLNKTTFASAVTTYQSSVEALFSDTSGSFSDTMRDMLDTYVDTSTGVITSLTSTISSTTDRLEDALTVHDARLVKYRARLQDQFNRLEALTSSFNTTQSFLTAFFTNDND